MNRLFISVLVCLALFASTALAQDANTNDDGLSIEAQPLASALREFSEQTGLQIGYAAELADGKATDGVDGIKDPEIALDTLLASSGLEHRFVNDSTVIIRETAVAKGDGGDSDPGNVGPAPVLMAQNQTTTSTETSSRSQATTSREVEDEEQVLEQIIVTGSRIRGAQNASPVVTITRDDIDLAGYATVEEVVENLPQNFGAGASTTIDPLNSTIRADVVGGAISATAGGTSVNLRGLGANSTLVLVNGHRISPSGLNAGFTNIGSIPVTAIERVEVLTDGASAIYGADAIAGVINFILREDYEGAETRLRYGSDSGGDTSNIQLGQTFGWSWESGNVLLSYEYFDQKALPSTDRAFTASSDLSPFGGTDWRQPGGSPANVVAGGQVFAVPDGQDGTALTAADFVGLDDSQNFFNEREIIDLLPDLQRQSVYLHSTQGIGDVELFAAARFATEENARRNNVATTFDFTVTDASPWFVDPTDSGLTEVRVRNYSIAEEAGTVEFIGEIDTYGATLGAEIEFPENWSSELTLNWSKEEALSGVSKGLDSAARATLATSVNLSDPALAFNPFSDGTNTNNRAILEQLFTAPFPQTSYENELRSAGLVVNGNLLELGGGAAQLAFGIDFRRESLFTVLAGSSFRIEDELSRDIRSAYAELFLPLFGQANSRTGLRRLEVSLAARHEDFSDFGSSTNPKLGILWSPLQSLTLKGTYGTSFRAPALPNLDETGWFAWFLPAGFLGPPAIFLGGTNPDLGAEEATTWTAGFQWTPKTIDGLSLDVTYFSVDFEGRIAQPFSNPFVALADPAAFPSVTIANPTPEQIAQFVNTPNFSEGRFAPGSAEELVSGAIPVDFIIDSRLTNLASNDVTGLELQLFYAADFRLGTFSAGVYGNYLIDFKRKLLPTDPLVDEVDTYGRPVDLRARGNVGWSRDNWSVTGIVNYTDGYTDNGSGPERLDDPRAVDSWTTVDLTVAYETVSSAALLSAVSISVTVQNLFDEDPPFVDTRGGIGYDAVNANPMGRFFAVQLTKEW